MIWELVIKTGVKEPVCGSATRESGPLQPAWKEQRFSKERSFPSVLASLLGEQNSQSGYVFKGHLVDCLTQHNLSSQATAILMKRLKVWSPLTKQGPVCP